MDTSNSCIETLDRASVDVLDVGYAWQEKSPMQASGYIGLLDFVAFNIALLLMAQWVVRRCLSN